jgi:hypothetical protein
LQQPNQAPRRIGLGSSTIRSRLLPRALREEQARTNANATVAAAMARTLVTVHPRVVQRDLADLKAKSTRLSPQTHNMCSPSAPLRPSPL